MVSTVQNHPNWDVIVIGGGPAGFFAAIRCAEVQPGAKILILEKGSQPLAKVKVSGGGRCNLTNACFDPAQLVTYYPRGSQELRGPYSRFQPRDTMAWFEGRGVPLKTEADGRVFPTSDSSTSILNCLLAQAELHRIVLRTRAEVRSAAWSESSSPFEVRLASDEALRAPRLLLATGGSRAGFHLAQSLGHTIQPPVPSLFTFNIPDARLDGLAGVSVEKVLLRLPEYAIQQEGGLLVTHWGLSGPAVLKLSAWGARALHAASYQADLLVNWLPDVPLKEMLERLAEKRLVSPAHQVTAHSFPEKDTSVQPLPLRLWKKLVEAAGIGHRQTWADLSRQQLARLAGELSQGRYRIYGKGVFKEEFVTCGGVTLKEVDFRSMQSWACPGLYLAGEVLDIDGLTGGFNFQAAWTTSWIAGGSLGDRKQPPEIL